MFCNIITSGIEFLKRKFTSVPNVKHRIVVTRKHWYPRDVLVYTYQNMVHIGFIHTKIRNPTNNVLFLTSGLYSMETYI